MALFHATDATDSNELAPRQSYLDTQGHYYTFSGLDGLEIEWHNISRNPDGTADDIHFLEPWIRSDFQKEPIISTSDVWDFQACNIKKTATYYYGCLVFELNRPGSNYEDSTPRGC